jgi:DDE domain
MSITPRSGAGCSITALSWSSDCEGISSPTNKSWRVDETYVRVKGRWCYLYRAIDSKGATIDFLLSALRDADSRKSMVAPLRSSEGSLGVKRASRLPRSHTQDQPGCKLQPILIVNAVHILRPGM